jgi:3-oxoacyl-[acyl-carrier-protein] synthase-3
MKYAKLSGWGFYVPERIVSNAELETLMDTSDEWIQERSGIKERRFFEPGVDSVSSMGAKASRIAIKNAGINAEDIDMIIMATLSSDYYFPGPGVLVQRELGLKDIPAFDIRQQCSGFIYGLSLAEQYIKTETYKNILLIGSEVQSGILEMSDRGRDFAVLFGDGAGAVVLQASDEPGVLSTHIHSDGEFAEELYMRNPGSLNPDFVTPEMIENGELLPSMNGKLVFKTAVQKFPEVIQEALDHNKLSVEDIDLFIPHQANFRITEFVRLKLGLPEEKVVSNIHKYGNTTAATIPIALAESMDAGLLKKGDLLCLAAFGSGFTWGSALIRI